MFENLKNIIYEKKKETVCLFFNFSLDGGFVFFFKGNILFDWTWVLKLYVIKGYATAQAGD